MKKHLFLLLFFFFALYFGQNITTVGMGYNFTYATDIAQDLDGNIYVCENSDQQIVKINDANNKTTVISAGNGKPCAIAVDDLNNVLYVAYESPGTNGGKIYKMNFDGSNPTLFSSPNVAITKMKTSGFYLWFVSSASTYKLGRIALSDGSVGYTDPLPYPIGNAEDFTFDNQGNSYFVYPSFYKVVKFNSTFSSYSISDDSGTSIKCIDFCPNLGLVVGGMSDIVIMGTDGTKGASWALPVYNYPLVFLPSAVEAREYQNAKFVIFHKGYYRVYNFKYPDNIFEVKGSYFDAPSSITLDSGNNIYVSDHDIFTGYNSIKKIAPNSAYFGGYNISNILYTTNTLGGIAYNSNSGNIYYGDKTANSIKFVDTSGSTYGDYITGLSNPYMMKSISGVGDFYTQRNYTYLTKRKLNFPSGFSYSYYGVLYDPKGFDFDNSGNVYVADYFTNFIQKINTTTGTSVNLGNIGNNFSQPSSVAVDSAHNVMYIADTGHNAIKRMDLDGNNITTIGSGFFKPEGVWFDSASNKLYVADTGYNVVKIVDLSTLSVSETQENHQVKIYPNPTTDFINISSEEKIKSAELYDMSGKLLFAAKSSKQISMTEYTKGMYLLKISFENGNIQTQKIIKK